MAEIIFGSARHDESNKYAGGKVGDQLQTSTDDYTGEVSMQKAYVHSKGWVILRPTSSTVAKKIARAMKTACNNPNIGYSQTNDRYGVFNNGVDCAEPHNTDCSSLVRACLKWGADITVADFNTSTEASVLLATGKFKKVDFTVNADLYTGDILVTKTKGHTVIVVSGNAREVTTKTYHLAKPTLKTGSTGEEVLYLQKAINKFAGQNLTTDSVYGSNTAKAVNYILELAYGKDACDGIYGPKAEKALKSLIEGDGYKAV